MNITTFLKKSINGELQAQEQKRFLQSKSDITPKELAAAVKFLMKQMPKNFKAPNAIDICGTGGSGLPRINTSTISAFILAKAGVRIAKHGNKAVSGRFGSFDLLENLGIDFTKPPSGNPVFLYAREYHPVMKHFAEVRREIGAPTFFNLLGPLLNPAKTKKQIIGTAFKDKMSLIAETCRLIGKEQVYVVCGEDGLDEVTLTCKTHVTELNKGKITSYTIKPEDFGTTTAKFPEIQGGSPTKNTEIALEILNGICKTRHLDLVLINTALALKLAGKVRTLKEGYELAKKTVAVFEAEFEIPKSDRDFYSAISKTGLSLIAEIKKKSPSEGLIAKQEFNPAKIAKNYEKAGADAISVLCDEKLFGGSVKYMQEARKSTNFTPILCKDFITKESQIYEARKYGADAILLIASLLTETKIKRFTKIAKDLNMDVLCEVHTLKELEKALKTPVKIIGINNRNLKTLKIDLKTTNRIAKHIPPRKLIVSESGIHSKNDTASLPKRTDAILVGTSLMKGLPPQTLARTKLKICGVRTVQTAKFCERNGVDFVGLNFVPTSKRKVSIQKAKDIAKHLKTTKKVGVFQNQPLKEVNKFAEHMDYIQLCGDESIQYIKKCKKPVIKTIALKSLKGLMLAEKYYPHVTFIIFDGANPGSGKAFDHKLLKNFKALPFFISGGLTPKNLKEALETAPLGIDLASGIETAGPAAPQIDTQKIKSILNQLKPC